jgi:hypothetical protein
MKLRQIRFLLGLGLSFVLGVEVSSAQPGTPDMRMTKLMAIETEKHVGDILPEGIAVVDAKGNKTDLRQALQGHLPAIVLKTSPKCPPCNELLDAVRRSQGKTEGSNPATIVVLQISDSDNHSLDLPKGVFELHSSSALSDEEIFVGGEITPSAFYFDSGSKLVERRAGMRSPQFLLTYPK